MAGQAAKNGLESIRRDVNSIHADNWNDTGVHGSDVSAIGGDGRKGGDGHGELKLPPCKRLDEEWEKRQGGKALQGEQGQSGGHGKTF